MRQWSARTEPPAAESVEPPPNLPGFRIEGKLGQGSLGIVYAAHDDKLNRRVAVKVLRRQGDDQVRRRVLEEARRAAALNDPAIITIFSVLDERDPPAIAMEWVEGFLLDRVAAQLNFEQKARLLREVARGPAVAHERGFWSTGTSNRTTSLWDPICVRTFWISGWRCRWRRRGRRAGLKGHRYTPPRNRSGRGCSRRRRMCSRWAA